jgi:hypothetical protein
VVIDAINDVAHVHRLKGVGRWRQAKKKEKKEKLRGNSQGKTISKWLTLTLSSFAGTPFCVTFSILGALGALGLVLQGSFIFCIFREQSRFFSSSLTFLTSSTNLLAKGVYFTSSISISYTQ